MVDQETFDIVKKASNEDLKEWEINLIENWTESNFLDDLDYHAESLMADFLKDKKKDGISNDYQEEDIVKWLKSKITSEQKDKPTINWWEDWDNPKIYKTLADFEWLCKNESNNSNDFASKLDNHLKWMFEHSAFDVLSKLLNLKNTTNNSLKTLRDNVIKWQSEEDLKNINFTVKKQEDGTYQTTVKKTTPSNPEQQVTDNSVTDPANWDWTQTTTDPEWNGTIVVDETWTQTTTTKHEDQKKPEKPGGDGDFVHQEKYDESTKNQYAWDITSDREKRVKKREQDKAKKKKERAEKVAARKEKKGTKVTTDQNGEKHIENEDANGNPYSKRVAKLLKKYQLHLDASNTSAREKNKRKTLASAVLIILNKSMDKELIHDLKKIDFERDFTRVLWNFFDEENCKFKEFTADNVKKYIKKNLNKNADKTKNNDTKVKHRRKIVKLVEEAIWNSSTDDKKINKTDLEDLYICLSQLKASWGVKESLLNIVADQKMLERSKWNNRDSEKDSDWWSSESTEKNSSSSETPKPNKRPKSNKEIADKAKNTITASTILNYLADNDASWHNLDGTLWWSVRRSGSEGELLEAFKDHCNIEYDGDNTYKFVDGPKTQQVIRTMIVNVLLANEQKSTKYNEITQYFFKKEHQTKERKAVNFAKLRANDFDKDCEIFDESKLTLGNLADFFRNNKEMKQAFWSGVDLKVASQELSDIIAGNTDTLVDLQDFSEAYSMAAHEALRKAYYQRFLNGKSDIPYDQLGSSEYHHLESMMFKVGQCLDTALSYIMSVSFGKDLDKRIEETSDEKELASLKEIKDLRQKLLDPQTRAEAMKAIDTQVWDNLTTQRSWIWQELNNPNAAKNALGQSIKFDILSLSLRVPLFRVTQTRDLNTKQTENQNMYSWKGVKTLNGSVSAEISWYPLLAEIPPLPAVSASIGVINDRVKGFENNQRAAVAWGTKFVDEKLINSEFDITKINSSQDFVQYCLEQFKAAVKNNSDPFLKNNEELLRQFFTKGLPISISGMFDKYKKNLEKANDKGKAQQDFAKVLRLGMINFFSAIRADNLRALDGHTTFEGITVGATFWLTALETITQFFTCCCSFHFKSYMMKRGMDGERKIYMDERLKKGDYPSTSVDVSGSITDACKNIRDQIGLTWVKVDFDSSEMLWFFKISADGALHKKLNLFIMPGAKNRKYKDWALYIGKDVHIEVAKQRLFDVQGTNLFISNKWDDTKWWLDNISKDFHWEDKDENSTTKPLPRPITSDCNGTIEEKGSIDTKTMRSFTMGDIEKAFGNNKGAREEFKKHLEVVSGTWTDHKNWKVKYKDSSGNICDLWWATVKMRKNGDNRKVENFTSATSDAEKNNELKIIIDDGNKAVWSFEEVKFGTDAVDLWFTNPESNWDKKLEQLLQDENFIIGMKFLKTNCMTKADYNIFMNNIGCTQGKDDIGTSAKILLESIKKALGKFGDSKIHKVKGKRRNLIGRDGENPDYDRVELQRDRFTMIQNALEKAASNQEIQQRICERIAGLMSYESLVNMDKCEDLEKGLKWLFEKRGTMYERLKGPNEEEFPLKWANIRNDWIKYFKENSVGLQDKSNVDGLVGLTAYYASSSTLHQWKTYDATVLGQTAVLWWEKGLLTLDAKQSAASAEWLKENIERTGNYKIILQQVAKKLNITPENLKTKLGNQNLLFVKEDGKWKLRTWDETIKLDDGTEIQIEASAVFYLYAACGNESLGIKIWSLKVRKPWTELTVGWKEEQQVSLSMTKATNSVTAKEDISEIMHTITASRTFTEKKWWWGGWDDWWNSTPEDGGAHSLWNDGWTWNNNMENNYW